LHLVEICVVDKHVERGGERIQKRRERESESEGKYRKYSSAQTKDERKLKSD